MQWSPGLKCNCDDSKRDENTREGFQPRRKPLEQREEPDVFHKNASYSQKLLYVIIYESYAKVEIQFMSLLSPTTSDCIASAVTSGL
jgi:hypothetical protein